MSQGYLFREAIGFLRSEILSGAWNRKSLLFEEYLANRVLAQEIEPQHLKSVLRFLLSTCARKNNTQCLDIVLYRHDAELPLGKLKTKTLYRLMDYSQRGPYEEHRRFFEDIRAELNRRGLEPHR